MFNMDFSLIFSGTFEKGLIQVLSSKTDLSKLRRCFKNYFYKRDSPDGSVDPHDGVFPLHYHIYLTLNQADVDNIKIKDQAALSHLPHPDVDNIKIKN